MLNTRDPAGMQQLVSCTEPKGTDGSGGDSRPALDKGGPHSWSPGTAPTEAALAGDPSRCLVSRATRKLSDSRNWSLEAVLSPQRG